MEDPLQLFAQLNTQTHTRTQTRFNPWRSSALPAIKTSAICVDHSCFEPPPQRQEDILCSKFSLLCTSLCFSLMVVEAPWGSGGFPGSHMWISHRWSDAKLKQSLTVGFPNTALYNGIKQHSHKAAAFHSAECASRQLFIHLGSVSGAEPLSLVTEEQLHVYVFISCLAAPPGGKRVERHLAAKMPLTI